MLYELYIDVFFVINAILDGLILAIVRKVQKSPCSRVRIGLGAMTGSGILSLLVCIPGEKHVMMQFIFYLLAYGCMSWVTFPGGGRKQRVKTIVLLYVVSLFVNGLLQWLRPSVQHITGVLLYSAAVYGIVCVLFWIFRQIHAEEGSLYTICIEYKEHKIMLKGLWDTGNRLRSPYHGKGVTVLSYDSIQQYIAEPLKQCIEKGVADENTDLGNEMLYFVPYVTVGGGQELMAVIEAKRLLIKKNQEVIEYKNPLLGISKRPVSEKNQFQAVLTTDG